MNLINEIVQMATSVTGAPLMVLDLWMLGYALKLLHGFPNRWIPPTIVTASILLCPWFLGWPCVGDMPHNLCCPEITCWAQIISQGALLGILAWGIHARYLRKWIDEKFKVGEGKTEFFSKPTNQPTP